MEMNSFELALTKEALLLLQSQMVLPFYKKDKEMHEILVKTLQSLIKKIEEEQNTFFIKKLKGDD